VEHTEQPPPPMGTPTQPPGPNPAEAVKLPAIFLIIVGGIGVLAALVGIVQAAAGTSQAQMQQLLSDPNLPPALRSVMGGAQGVGIIGNIFMLLAGGLQIFGGVKMMQLRSFGLAMAASIVALIPCWGSCCCIGIPVGIWALIVLNKPEVKTAFR
jgi:hypothetical protein